MLINKGLDQSKSSVGRGFFCHAQYQTVPLLSKNMNIVCGSTLSYGFPLFG
jgi:hypothetical protein